MKPRQLPSLAIATIVLAGVCLAHYAMAEALSTSSGAGGNDCVNIGQTMQKVLRCVPGVNPAKIDPTVQAFTKAYEHLTSSGKVKPPSTNELHHMLAQILEETGHLGHLTELHPTSAPYQGRGFIQLTGKVNYNNCVQFVQDSGDTTSNISQIARGGAAADKIIGKGATDLYLSAMCTIGWWEDSKTKSPAFQAAVDQGKEGVNVVSTTVNAGPEAKPGTKINGLTERQTAYDEVSKCM